MNAWQQISGFVNQRERAYQYSGRLDMTRQRAISRLKNILSYISRMDASRQRKYLANYKHEIRLILPPEGSRFEKLRQRIINLLTSL